MFLRKDDSFTACGVSHWLRLIRQMWGISSSRIHSLGVVYLRAVDSFSAHGMSLPELIHSPVYGVSQLLLTGQTTHIRRQSPSQEFFFLRHRLRLRWFMVRHGNDLTSLRSVRLYHAYSALF